MLILLPPSEGKTAPTGGPPLDLDAMSNAVALTAARQEVLAALTEVSARPHALEILGVGARLAPEVERNTRLTSEPTAPAAQVYTGVLYAAARLDELRGVQAERAAESVLTVSALWGAVSPADLVPAYRLSMGTQLPGLGKLAGYWKPRLTRALSERASGDLVVDCRSAAYAAAWAPPADAEHVTVSVVREAAGKRTVVSHNAKHTRGLLTGYLLTRPAPVGDADALAAAAAELADVRDVELSGPDRAGHRTLTLVL